SPISTLSLHDALPIYPRAPADGIAMQELATTWPIGSPAMRVLVMLPTYNEIENIQEVLERARAALPDADILVIDDGSPDGTADRSEEHTSELQSPYDL